MPEDDDTPLILLSLLMMLLLLFLLLLSFKSWLLPFSDAVDIVVDGIEGIDTVKGSVDRMVAKVAKAADLPRSLDDAIVAVACDDLCS